MYLVYPTEFVVLALQMDQRLYTDSKDCMHLARFFFSRCSHPLSLSPSQPLIVVKLMTVMPSDAYD